MNECHIRWLIPNPRASGGAPDRAGRRTRTKSIARELSARTWVRHRPATAKPYPGGGQRRSGVSAGGAGVRDQPSIYELGAKLGPGPWIIRNQKANATTATATLIAKIRSSAPRSWR